MGIVFASFISIVIGCFIEDQRAKYATCGKEAFKFKSLQDILDGNEKADSAFVQKCQEGIDMLHFLRRI